MDMLLSTVFRLEELNMTSRRRIIGVLLFLYLVVGCDPIVTTFEDNAEVVMYEAAEIYEAGWIPPEGKDEIVVMTWNIRFGAARIPWFGDGCGDRVILSDDEVAEGLQGVANKIDSVQPDILLMQEVDVLSKRSGYEDEVQWLLDHTYLNYGAYASVWQSQFIPSDGLGRMDMGNAVLSRWPIVDAERIPLALRSDQDALTQYFYLRRNILKAEIDGPFSIPDNLYVVNIHATAFSTDDTKLKHLEKFKEVLDEIDEEGYYFVAGGDMNEIPSGAAKLDYCLEDACEGESFHTDADGGPHREGSYFLYFPDENEWLEPLDQKYNPAVPRNKYLLNESAHFTHAAETDSTNENYDWNRKLDYLWTNVQWVTGSDSTHQDGDELSDHAAVSCRLNLGVNP